MAIIPWVLLASIVLIVLFFAASDLWRGAVLLVRSRREAEARAACLLAEILPVEDLRHLNERGYIVVRSPSRANRVYHVPRRQGMVSVYDGGILAERLCVGSTTRIPDGDAVLLHKLMIEGSEEEYLNLANHFSPRPYTFPV